MQKLRAFIIMSAVCATSDLLGQTVKEYVHFGDRVVASESRVVTGNFVPQAGGVSPASGSSLSQTFEFSYSDANGANDINVVNVLINNTLSAPGACYVGYVRSANILVLVPDSGDANQATGMALTPGGGSLSNSQCRIWQSGSFATQSGNTLKLTLNVAFNSIGGWPGKMAIWMAVADLGNASSGWQALGVWNMGGVAATPAQVSSANPARRTGGRGTVAVTFSHTTNFASLGVQNILINRAIDGANACFLAFVASANLLYLVTDPGDDLLGLSPTSPGGSAGSFIGSVANSQCRVYGATSSYQRAGNGVTLLLDLELLPAFSGNRMVFGAARTTNEVGNSGWQPVASWSR